MKTWKGQKDEFEYDILNSKNNMEKNFDIGQVVTHKASKQRMTIYYAYSPETHIVKCRFLNPITGLYEVQEFKTEELKPSVQR